MNLNNKRIAGLLFLAGTVQFVLVVIISESVYSGYSVGHQAVSDLGDWNLAGNYAAIFNASVILLGSLVISGAYFILREIKSRLFSSLLVIGGVGMIGVGVVAENISFSVHVVLALFIFVFFAATAIMSYKFEKSPLSHMSVVLGVLMLLAIILLILGRGQVNSGFYLGIGYGGMERLIIYPLLLWTLGFGAYLIGDSSQPATRSKA